MLFSEPMFFLFFSGYFTLHLLLPNTLMLSLLVVGSCFFYGYWNPAYLVLPIGLVLFTHYLGRRLANASNQKARRFFLFLGVSFLLAPLVFFKYINFFTGLKLVNLALPLGISFITFTLLAYLVDVYRGKFQAERNVLYLLSSVLFFPHLIAGPIVRPSQLIPQLKRWNPRISGRLTYGLLVFSVGLFKKLVIADPIGSIVNQTYLSLDTTLSAWMHLISFYGFSIQIYCDFSGYTDMALGLSQILGIRLPRNFNRPYVATSIVDFWNRWHITLSSWLKDYLYISLGGNRRGMGIQVRNIIITMGLGGLWHGANWTFLFWGLFHAAGITVQHLLGRMKVTLNLPKWMKIIFTFHFVSIGWVYFRASSLGAAHQLMSGIFSKSWSGWSPSYMFPVFLSCLFLGTHFLDSHRNLRFLNARVPRTLVLVIVLFLVVLASIISNGSSAEFIYFDF